MKEPRDSSPNTEPIFCKLLSWKSIVHGKIITSEMSNLGNQNFHICRTYRNEPDNSIAIRLPQLQRASNAEGVIRH